MTAQILQEPGIVIAMSTEHRSVVRERFNRQNVRLFTEACGLPGEPLPAVDEVVRMMKRTLWRSKLTYE